MSDKGSETGADKGAMAGAPPESHDRDPWAPPERRAPLDGPGEPPVPQQRVPLDKPAARTAPGQHDAVPPAAPQGVPTPHPYAFPPAGSAVPPVPQAPTGPGTPSAYPAGPYGQQPYGQAPYGRPGQAQGAGWYPQTAYGQQPPYGQGPYAPPGSYGYPAAPYGPGWQHPGPAAGNGLGVAALVLGIIGTVLSPTVFLGVILGILAIVFGGIGRTKVSSGEADNGGQTLAGLILGGVALVASVLMLIFYINFSREHRDTTPEEDPGATYGAYLSAPVLLVDRGPGR
ncbi:hypothetical protein AB0H17_21015 [Streptomyces olivoreticuli]